MLADIYEHTLADPRKAMAFYGRAASRLAERGDPKDVMLGLAMQGLNRVGPRDADSFAEAVDALAPVLSWQHRLALERAVADAMMGQPRLAGGRLTRLYEAAPDNDHAAVLYDDADRLLALAGDRAGQARLRDAARTRTADPERRTLLAREKADLLTLGPVTAYAAALRQVIDDDPADGAALERLVSALEQAHARGEAVGRSLEEALELAARLHKGERGLPQLRRLARLRQERGDVDGALETWREVLARRPGDVEAMRATTDLLAVSTDPARRAELRSVLDMRLSIARNTRDAETVAQVVPRLVEILDQEGATQEADAIITTTLKTDPDNDPVNRLAATRLAAAARWADLAALQEDLMARRVSSVDRETARLQAARTWHQRLGNGARARELLAGLLESSPNHVEALDEMALVALAAGEPGEAAQRLRRLVTLAKGGARAQVCVRLGQLLAGPLGQPEEARACFRDALAADSAHRPALEALRDLATQAGQAKEARSVSAELAALEPDPARRADLYMALASQAKAAGEPDVATRLTEHALAALPSHLDAVQELATTLVERGDSRRARPLLQQLVDGRGPEAVPTRLLVDLARMKAAVGETAAAKRYLRAGIKGEPPSWEPLRALADLLRASKEEDPRDVLEVLERVVAHPEAGLADADRAATWAHVGRLRRQVRGGEAAEQALHEALAALPAGHADPALVLEVARLAEETGRMGESLDLYTRLAKATVGATAASHWVKVGALARARGDNDTAAHALREARRLDPDRRDTARALAEVEIEQGAGPEAIRAVTEALAQETDPSKQAHLHLQLAKLYRQPPGDLGAAAAHLRQAVEKQPLNGEALDLCEQVFLEKKDARGLQETLSSVLFRLPDDAPVEVRTRILGRVALLRRYELRDTAGAAEALEEIVKLDDQDLKAWEDLARLRAAMGDHDRAVACWREVLSRDAMSTDAYRGMLAIFRRGGQWDAAYCVAATLVALDEADDEVKAIARALRPPFPSWPKPAVEPESLVRRMVHPRAVGTARDLLAALTPHVLPLYARPLREWGLTAHDKLDLEAAPSSFSMATRHSARILGLPQVTLYRGDTMHPGINVVVSDRPGLQLGPDVLRGGMTPERAFLFGRAAAYLRPEALLCSVLNAHELKSLLDAALLRAVPRAEVEGKWQDLDKLGRELERRVPRPEWTRALELARAYHRAREDSSVADLVTGTGFTADRAGFLLAQDLAVSMATLREQTGSFWLLAGRVAVRELVLFSVSPALLALRQELGITVSPAAAERVLGDR
jgi:tetratricopeptide (TPR) repeat protein